MSCFDKDDYKYLKYIAKNEGITVISTEVEGGHYNGITIAFSKLRPNCKMIHVAVSYCSKEDKYKRKHGNYQALLKYCSGEAIQLPLAQYWNDLGEDSLHRYLFGVFGV